MKEGGILKSSMHVNEEDNSPRPPQHSLTCSAKWEPVVKSNSKMQRRNSSFLGQAEYCKDSPDTNLHYHYPKMQTPNYWVFGTLMDTAAAPQNRHGPHDPHKTPIKAGKKDLIEALNRIDDRNPALP